MLWLESIQMKLAFFFFSFATSFLCFTTLLFFLCFRPGCNCHVCRSYLSSAWQSRFDNLSDWYVHLLRESPTQTVQIHVLNTTITANPKNVEYMLKTNFDNFPKGKPFSSILADLLGRGIFNVDGDEWKFQRKMASHELGSVSVRSYTFSITSGEVRHRLFPLLDSVSDSGSVIDLQEIFRKFSFDTIGKISFGLDPGCLDLSLPSSDFAAAFDLASNLSAMRAVSVTPVVWKLKRLMNWGSEKDLHNAICVINKLAEDVITRKRKLGFSSDHDLLSRFMASVDNDKYLRDIVVSFLLAGRDTVASGLTTFFYLLAQNPNVVAKIREEIDRLKLDDNHGTGQDVMISYDKLRSMRYVHAAIYESLRLYPPVQFDSKFCLDDDVLPDGTFVGRDSRVTYHPYAMGRMRMIWGDDCEAYRPERWLGQHGDFVPVNAFRFPVFQGGARTCLGKEMSIMEMKTVAVSVIRDFDVNVVGDRGAKIPKFKAGLTASLSGGLMVTARRRPRDPRGYMLAENEGVC